MQKILAKRVHYDASVSRSSYGDGKGQSCAGGCGSTPGGVPSCNGGKKSS